MLEFAELKPGQRLLDFMAGSCLTGRHQTLFITLPWQDHLKDS